MDKKTEQKIAGVVIILIFIVYSYLSIRYDWGIIVSLIGCIIIMGVFYVWYVNRYLVCQECMQAIQTTDTRYDLAEWLVKNTPKEALECPRMKGWINLHDKNWWVEERNAKEVLWRVKYGNMPPSGFENIWTEKQKQKYIKKVEELVKTFQHTH